MNPYRQSLDVRRIQRRMRFDPLRRFWRHWGDPMLAGVLIALTVWMVVASDDRPHPRGAVHAEVSK